MASLFETASVSTALLPTTSWTAPNGLFGAASRNDGYTWDATTSTVTLPNTADGYLIVGAFEFEDSSNGRHNPQARFVLASGTGTFVSGNASGYNRDTSEDRSYCRAFGFIDGNSNGAEIQFQWRRDTDAPTGGTVRSQFQVIELYYSDFGIYSSASTACPGGTTPNQVVGFTGTDGSNITLASDTITVAGDNKRYLCLGSYYWQGIGAARSQRWGGFRLDGVFTDYAKGYSYARDASNADIGEIFTTIVETSTADRTLDMAIYRGNGQANGEGGAQVDGNTTGSNPNHVMVVLELNDSAEVFHTVGSANQNIATPGPIDVTITQVADIEFNDAASFTRSSDTAMNVEQDMDVLMGANLSAASENVGSGSRFTGYSEFTINGTEDVQSFAGDYLRGNQGSQDTFGWSANLLSFRDVSSGDDLGVSATELVGSEGGGNAVNIQVGWAGFWGLNLDSLQGGAPPVTPRRVIFIS